MNFVIAQLKILNKEFSEYEIILVNDASKDDTMEKIRLLCKKNKKIKAINLKQNLDNTMQFFTDYFCQKENMLWLWTRI